MKKHVEDQIKNAVDSWDQKTSDVGFDKNLVWDSIQSKSSKPSYHIHWFKIAAAVVLLLMTWGWGNTYFSSRALKQENIVMVGNIQTLGNEIKTLQQAKQRKIINEPAQTDTIIQLVNKPVESSELLNRYEEAKNKNNALEETIAILNQQLEMRDAQYKVLTDSFYVLNQDLEYYKSHNSYDLALADKNVKLEINEAALSAISTKNTVEKNTPTEPKNKLKLVLFNKSKSSESKAPAAKGIRL
ncbi:hypothetical protein [Labilibacter marinus]|uniref:hypothetical protein n=1 Tax=Labilibacter marinus TaxID=1477105 RepID=UPI000831B35D|nr:hypothetical protein [Labilibacter marinus]